MEDQLHRATRVFDALPFSVAKELQLAFDAMTRSARVLGLLPLHTDEFEFNVLHDGTVPSLEYWPSHPRMEAERQEVPIPRAHAHLFDALGRFLLGLRDMGTPDAAYLHELHRTLHRVLTEVLARVACRSPLRAGLESLLTAASVLMGDHVATLGHTHVLAEGDIVERLPPSQPQRRGTVNVSGLADGEGNFQARIHWHNDDAETVEAEGRLRFIRHRLPADRQWLPSFCPPRHP